MLSEYLTLENVYPTLKFIGVLATGMYTGASVYLGSTHMPSMLAMSDMSQALVQFQYFWPKERHLPISGIISGLSGIAVYLVKRNPNDLPWLIGGIAMTAYGFYTMAVIFPNSIGPLLKAHPDEDEKRIRSLLEKFTSYHYGRLLTGIAAFVTYTYCFGFK